MVNDRRISFLRLGGEVRGCLTKKLPWSVDQKKPKLLGNRSTDGWSLYDSII